MTDGRDYETFVYDKLKKFFPTARVEKNDFIVGSLSGIRREIDVSIRFDEPKPVLLIASCKDYRTRPVEIGKIEELATIIRDVGAAKAWLLCTSGFAKSNRTYARNLGIELITIEDVESDVWTAHATLPVVVYDNQINYMISCGITVTEELAELYPDKPPVLGPFTNDTRLRTAAGTVTVIDWLRQRTEAAHFNAREGGSLDIGASDLEVELLPNIWVPASEATVTFTVTTRYFVKEYPFDEYSQLVDHVRRSVIPLNASASNLSFSVDDTWDERTLEEVSAFPGLVIQLDQWDGPPVRP